MRRAGVWLVSLGAATAAPVALATRIVSAPSRSRGAHSGNRARTGDRSRERCGDGRLVLGTSAPAGALGGLHSKSRGRIGGRVSAGCFWEPVMTSILEFLARLAVWLLLAPLLPGIINKVKA